MAVRPFDPRLARDIAPVRGSMWITAIVAFVIGGFTALQAVLAAQAIAKTFLGALEWSQVGPWIFWALAAWCGRAVAGAFSDYSARRRGLLVVAEARASVVRRLLDSGASSSDLPAGAVFSLLTRGVDGLEIYVARYLPQLVISAVVPVGLGAVIYWLDPLSALILLITIPLIPLFMALVGWFTSDHVDRHWRQVMGVAGTLQDLLAGLPELKVFGRARAQVAQIRRLGEQQQVATMRVLRLSFLSAFVLELLATLSVAIIAVAIGLRLVNGEMTLWRGLAALVLAPEVFAPLRMLGVHYHAAVEGLEAWNKVTHLLDSAPVAAGKIPLQRVRGVAWQGVVVENDAVAIRMPDGRAVAGELIAVVGPSGCGKTTLLESLLGLRETADGAISWESEHGAESLYAVDLQTLYAQVGLVGQNPWLGEGTVREVITRGLTEIPPADEIRDLLQSLALSTSLEIPISDRSEGVSAGQRRRYAIARALLRKPAVMVLDEPAAALDFETEQLVIDVVQKYVQSGGIAVVVAHRAGFKSVADRVVEFAESSVMSK